MEVVQNHGPCSLGQGTAPSLSEVLSHDQARVRSIQTRITNKRTITRSNLTSISDEKVDLPTYDGESLGVRAYTVTVGVGTPKRTLQLAFDTGSDLTWTQCQPCVRHCYKQQDPIFNPLNSTSYKNVSCGSTECSRLFLPRCNSWTCIYGIRYGDGSYSVGFLSRDKLTISTTDFFSNFIFGCGESNNGTFGVIGGLIGLGRNALSLVSQTASKYKKIFSYCLPSSSSETGHLTLGNSTTSTPTKFTPLYTKRGTDVYFINIISISVGGIRLNIDEFSFKSDVIIDSGTTLAYLPPDVYKNLRDTFRKQMDNHKYKTAPTYEILDTCYNLKGYKHLSIPTVSFTFGGNSTIDLKSVNILIPVSKSRLCLAFASNTHPDGLTIYGNTQQKMFEVIYDAGKGRLGFAPDRCY